MVMMTHDPAFILWVDDKRWSSASMSSIQHHQPHYQPHYHQQHPHHNRAMSSLSPSMTSHSSMGSQLRHDHLDHHSHHHQSRDDDGDDVRDDTHTMMYWTCLACRMPRNRVDRDTEHCLKCHAIKGSRLQLRCNTSTE
jgi:hypothetical protein